MSGLPERLALLEVLTKKFHKDTLEDTYLICCQHVLPSLLYFMRSAEKLGLKKENIAIIGKCYSTSKLAVKMLREDGLFVSDQSFAYNSHLSFDEQFAAIIYDFLQTTLQKIDLSAGKKIIILDDGGQLLQAANDLLADYPNILGVEQTSSGYNKLCQSKLNFPIVNVARSVAKLKFESPHIATSILHRLNTLTPLADKSLLIIGQGVIGSEVAHHHRAQVDFYDIAFAKPLHETYDLQQYDCMIGATGTQVLDSRHYPLLKDNVFLASVSSSDREFSAVTLRKQVAQSNDCHAHMKIKHINLLNAGFPINFYGSDYDNVPLQHIQLTVALLFAGICQKLPSSKGFLELDTDIQNILINAYIKITESTTA